jgi:RNA polymerase sigma factor (sigma-70 family)
MPVPAKAFVFATARNLLIDRVRKENIVPIEAMADLDTLGIALDEPGPDRSAIARQELRRLQAALDQLPPRQREAVLMRKIEGLSRPEIAAHMGIAEATVSVHLATGMAALADFFHSEKIETGDKL